MSRAHGFEVPIVSWLNQLAPQGILVTDANLNILGWNVWLEMNSGKLRADVLEKPLFEVFPEIAQRGLNVLYEDALAGQVRLLSPRFHEYLIEMRSPAEMQFEKMLQTAHVAPLMEGPTVIGTITAISDVTERVAREREARAAQEAAEAANKSKDKFVAMLSHDLRVPLNSISGWLQMMQRFPEDPAIRSKAMKSIEQSTISQLRMIEDLLDVTRISAGKLELDLDDADVADVVDAACNALKPIAESKNVNLIASIDSGVGPLRADAKRIQQVVWNLISNALKFTPRGGSVSVQLERRNRDLCLTVADTGIGLAPDALTHIFEPMWQMKNEHTSSGLGLGLTIVRRVVELHGGSVHAESLGLGKGATFTVKLPLPVVSRPA
jgi:signal transduction histidine kinase